MKKYMMIVLFLFFSVMLLGCDYFMSGSVDPRDIETNTFELLFDDVGLSILESKVIEVKVNDTSDYTGNLVGPAAIVTFDYLLINPTDESISFDVIWVYPNYNSLELDKLLSSLTISFNAVELDRTYQQIIYPDDSDYDLFSYDYIEPMIEDTAYSDDDENFPVNFNYCSRFTLTIEPQSENVIHISLPTWPAGDRTKPAQNLMYVITLDVASFNDIETYITYYGNRELLHSNHTIEFHSIKLTEDENNVNLFVEYITWDLMRSRPYCTYIGSNN